ncbi:hypothetical protein KSS87_021080 [Heliosperma pusillum]|nr:hypothetical protein KSS87_021080 [Heliosperma pusillum]
MLVANSFDSWQRDVFFSAAEEDGLVWLNPEYVGLSTCFTLSLSLESAFRTWFSARRDGISSNGLEELCRELQTALGTAKWQLEEFAKAVRSSYGTRYDENSMSRHQQFIVAIESQIFRAEDALKKSFDEEGKEKFRWVNLNEDERDDLAMFLSGFSETPTKSTSDETTSHSLSSERDNIYKKHDLDCGACSSSYSAGSNIMRKDLSSRDEIVINMGLPDSVMERSAYETSSAKVNVNWESDRTGSVRRAQSVSNFSSLSILVPGEDDQTQTLIQEVEDTPKEKGSRLSKFLQFRALNYISQSLTFLSKPRIRGANFLGPRQ